MASRGAAAFRQTDDASSISLPAMI